MAFVSFVHLVAMGLWLGALVATLVLGGAADDEDGFTRAFVYRIIGTLHGAVIAPAAAVTVLSGLFLTLAMLTQSTGDAGRTTGDVIMEATGMLAGIAGLMVDLPTASRTARLAVPDEAGNLPSAVTGLRRRQQVSSSVTLVLVLAAFFFGIVVQ